MNNYNLKISIGVPVYNVEKYIERCAISLFEQTYPNIEYVFVDDRTPDRSIEILESIIFRYTIRKSCIKLIRNASNLGAATSRNIILDNCTGDFLLWVDADDYIELDTVYSLVKIQQRHNCDILGFGTMKHSINREFPYMPHLFFSPQDMFLSIMRKKTDNTLWGRLIRRSLFFENDIRFEDGQNVGEDFKVIILLAYYAKKIYSVKDIFYHYDCSNPVSLMSSFSVEKAMMAWHNIDVTENFFNGKGPFYEDAFKKKEANTIVTQMIRCYLDKDNHIDFIKYLKKRARNLKIKDFQEIDFVKKIIFLIPSYSMAKNSCRIMKKIQNYIS